MSFAGSRRLGLLLLVTVLLQACGQGGGDAARTAGEGIPDSSASGRASSLPSPDSLTEIELGQIERTHVQLVLPWGMNPTRRGAPDEGAATLAQWEVRGREGFDRFTLTFGQEDPVPGYEVELVEGPIRVCGEGAPVETRADAFLRVRLNGARSSADLQSDTSIRPRRNVKALHLTCRQPDRLEFVLELAAERSYRILEVRSPRRLVVDVRNTVGEG